MSALTVDAVRQRGARLQAERLVHDQGGTCSTRLVERRERRQLGARAARERRQRRPPGRWMSVRLPEPARAGSASTASSSRSDAALQAFLSERARAPPRILERARRIPGELALEASLGSGLPSPRETTTKSRASRITSGSAGADELGELRGGRKRHGGAHERLVSASSTASPANRWAGVEHDDGVVQDELFPVLRVLDQAQQRLTESSVWPASHLLNRSESLAIRKSGPPSLGASKGAPAPKSRVGSKRRRRHRDVLEHVRRRGVRETERLRGRDLVGFVLAAARAAARRAVGHNPIEMGIKTGFLSDWPGVSGVACVSETRGKRPRLSVVRRRRGD